MFNRRHLVGALVILSLNFTGIARADQSPSYDRTWRFGTMPIPKLKQVPTIDGVIDQSEWSKASLFPALLSMDPLPGNGMPPRNRSTVWMAYTDDALYVAWRQDLPSQELPVEPNVTDKRDACEGRDNTLNLWFNTDPKGLVARQFNLSGNAASQIYDRRFDTGEMLYWNGDLTYKSRILDKAWEGEWKIPFATLGLKSAPADGARWSAYIYSAWRKGGTRLFAWPYVMWGPQEAGWWVFAGDTPGVRFEKDGEIVTSGPGLDVKTSLLRRKDKSLQSYEESLATAMSVSQGEGATGEKFEKLVADAVAGFEPATAVSDPGEYLMRYEIHKGAETIGAGVQPLYKPAPLELVVRPMYLSAQQIIVEASADSDSAKKLEASLAPSGKKAEAPVKDHRAVVRFASDQISQGQSANLLAVAKDDSDKIVAKAQTTVTKPAPPSWWTQKFGLEPKVPPPFTPVKADAKKAEILGRQYDFAGDLALPSQITTRGESILAAPMSITTSQPWTNAKLELVNHDDEQATYHSTATAGNVTLSVNNRVEFDGFMYVDLNLTGDGTIDKLDLAIPFKKQDAILLQNYAKCPGPGDLAKGGGNHPDDPSPYKKGKRFVGEIPSDGLKTPPMMTTWIGTDHRGLELSCESSRGWAMQKPNEAVDVQRSGDQVVLNLHLISKPVKLSKDTPRHIRFGLIGTPSKTLLPYLQKARLYDDVRVWLLPNDWSGHPCWHAPVTDPKDIERFKGMIDPAHKLGERVLVNGGWNITADHADWEYWGKEMTAEPLQNVSWQNVKQFAACYNTPYKEFLPNSFGYNAKLFGIDGIRFDTVTPGYECKSLIHKLGDNETCGWTDDDGNLWPTTNLFAQREAWKRLYRVFHGEEIKEGFVYVPVAAGPVMPIHSFADVHEIGESYYEKAKTIKDGYPQDMIRAMMNGEPYGLRSQSNLKGQPLFVNQRIAALLAANGDPRFGDYRMWRPDYSAMGNPASNIMEAWEWVDRWNAQFLGWWENGEFVSTDAGNDRTVYASFHLNRDKKRVLLCVTNYDLTPINPLTVKLNLAALGLSGAKMYAEDAVTQQSIALSEDGTIKLDVLPERYRLIKISTEKPQFSEENFGENILKKVPAELSQSWQTTFALEPNATYVLTAQYRIDKPIGFDAAVPNGNGGVSHFFSPFISGAGTECIAAKNPIVNTVNDNYPTGPVPYRKSLHYLHQCMQQHWEATGGWVTLMIPYTTDATAKDGALEIRMTEPDQVQIKDLAVRKVK